MSAAGGPAGSGVALRRLRRRWLRLWRSRAHRLQLVFSDTYVQPLPVPHIDGERGRRVLCHLLDEGLVAPRDVHRGARVSVGDLLRVHTRDYLDSLQEARSLTRLFGVDLDDPTQDAVLEGQRAMVGGTIEALRLAVRGRRPVVQLGGGLHHAMADRGQGFCAFNDVAVAVRRLRADGFDDPILVVDLDLHDGEGTRSIFADDPTVHTLSIHNRHLGPVDAVASSSVALGTAVGNARYLGALDEHLASVADEADPSLVIYLAGVDVADDDPLGDWKLDDRTILERDRRVAELARERTAALAVCLAGGYGRSAWRYNARFCGWLARPGESVEPPTDLELTVGRLRGIARALRVAELTTEPDDDRAFVLTEDDLMPGLPVRTRFLGFYSRHGVELALERSGILESLRKLGFRHPHVEWDLSGQDGETIRVRDDDESEPLIELRARRDRTTVEGHELLFIEWMMLQNPRKAFSERRPALPGQRHPGLGLLRDFFAVLFLACERLGLDGIAFVPSEYHIVARVTRRLVFVDPAREARFRALRRAVGQRPLVETNRLLEAGRVVDCATGEPVTWEPAPVILPSSDALIRRFLSEEYEARVAQHDHEFVIRPPGDRDCPDSRANDAPA